MGQTMRKATRYVPSETTGFTYPCLAGSVCRDKDGSSLYAWALFKRSDIDSEMIAAHGTENEEEDYPYDLGVELTGWYSYSNGVGRWFSRMPRTIIGRNHILVIQFRAMDI